MNNVPYGQRGAATMALRMKKRLELDPADVLKLFAEIDRLTAELRAASAQPAGTVLVPRDVLVELVKSSVDDDLHIDINEMTCCCCGVRSGLITRMHADDCAVGIDERLLAGGDA